MEIKKTGRFITDFYGSSPAVGCQSVLSRWVESKQDQALLSFVDQIKKKGETSLSSLESILSIFHRNADGNPVLGSWMLKRCLVMTGQTIFNAMKDKTHPKRDIIPMAIQLVEPFHVELWNGSLIKEPQGVRTYTVSIKKPARSFFKAYEYIKAGTTFDVSITIDDEILSDEHVDMLLAKAGSVGVGAFRERFGKFVWV